MSSSQAWAIGLGMALAFCSLSSAGTLTVDINGTGDYRDIQSAIDDAVDGDTILVLPGEYIVSRSIDFNRLHHPGDPKSPPLKNLVVRSELGADETTIRMWAPYSQGVPVAIFRKGEGKASVLEGFTLTGGRVYYEEGGKPPEYEGAGVCCYDSSPTLRNCHITENSADYGTGGVDAENSSLTLIDCRITGNSRGGVSLYESSASLTNCVITGNSGGGLYANGDHNVVNCTISGNSGVGVSVFRSSPTFTDCTVVGNSESGLRCRYQSSPTVVNCTIRGNARDGISCFDSSPILTNCTVTANLQHAVFCENASPVFTNCILWDNLLGSIELAEESAPAVSYSCVEGEKTWPGEGNSNTDPLFCGWGSTAEVYVDASQDEPGDGTDARPYSSLAAALDYNLALSLTSPCLGSGEGGANMGADTGTCEAAGQAASRLLHLAPGTYSALGLSLHQNVSIEGAGQSQTVIEGTLLGLRTGSMVSNITSTAGLAGGLHIGPGEDPSILDCTISGNMGSGIYCHENSSPLIADCTISDNKAWEGGGIYCLDAWPHVSRCLIAGNIAYFGGGLCCAGDSGPTLTECTILENSAWPEYDIDGYYREGAEGGGVYCTGVSYPSLTNCALTGNSAYWGGGLFCDEYSVAVLTECTISDNSAGGGYHAGGGGVYATDRSSPRLVDCDVQYNSASWYGGGISCGEESSLNLTMCEIMGNYADEKGGGIYCEGSSQATVDDCRISENECDGETEGGGLYLRTDGATVGNCAITGNTGGGAHLAGASSLTNCTITLNIGGGAHCESSSPSITSCTITDNFGGGVSCGDSFPVLANCIVWGNYGESIGAAKPSNPEVRYSCVEGKTVWPGEGNINDNPLFCGWGSAAEVYVDASAVAPGDGTKAAPFPDLGAALDYSLALSLGSPCLSSGEGGMDMGADLGTCSEHGGLTERLVHLAVGTYSAHGLSLFHNASVQGSGQAVTIIEGNLEWLRTGTRVSDLTVGGIRVSFGQDPEIVNCAITGNGGVGVICQDSAPIFNHCTISDNEWGGLLATGSSSPTLNHCLITENRATALRCEGESSVGLNHCVIRANTSSEYALDLSGVCSLTHCTISHNEGGGVSCGTGSTLMDCVVMDNFPSEGWSRGGCGVKCSGSPTLINCTIAGNSGDDERNAGVYCAWGASPTLLNCIVWANSGTSIFTDKESSPQVSYSCLEGKKIWPGEGNINDDPLFCGWGAAAEVYVDASQAGPGDGSKADPYPDLASALGFNLALSLGSPCQGTGEGGVDMGADLGECLEAGRTARLVHLAPGIYSLDSLSLQFGASIDGAGPEETMVEGTVIHLRTGATLSNLSVKRIRAGSAEAPEIVNCTIKKASNYGLYCLAGAAPALRDCRITENLEGGAYCDWRSTPSFENCTISGNRGSGLVCDDAFPTLDRCTILGNSAESGGGLRCSGGTPVLNNCIISGNSAHSSGGGVQCNYGSPNLFNCTIAGNRAPLGSGLCSMGRGSPPTLANCIVWNNPGEGIRTEPDALPDVRYSCVQSGWEGEGNTSGNPLFFKEGVFDFGRFTVMEIDGEEIEFPEFVVEEPDYRLRPGSPATDAGTEVGAPQTDRDGNTRPCGKGVDMGALESDCFSSILLLRGDCNGDGFVGGNVTDIVFYLNWAFIGGKNPGCLAACDVNGDGTLGGNVTDAVYYANWAFLGGPPPPAPFPECGWGAKTDEQFGCEFPPLDCP